jgi:hypothetical protein
MSNVVVKENHLTFGGVAYYRAHAEEVEIGSIGEKRKPLFKDNYLEVKDRVLVPEKNIIKATVAEIDFTKTTKSAFKLKAKAVIDGVPANLDGDAVFNKLRSGDLKLVKFSISNNDMKDAINQSPEAIESLKFWDRRARVALQVFIVIEAKLAEAFNKDINIGLSAGVSGLKAEVGANFASNGTTSLTLSKDTCFAYLIAKVRWDAKKKSERQKIVDLDDDQWGLS